MRLGAGNDRGIGAVGIAWTVGVVAWAWKVFVQSCAIMHMFSTRQPYVSTSFAKFLQTSLLIY